MSAIITFFKENWDTNLPKLREIFQVLQEIRSKIEKYLKENAKKLKNFVSDVANLQIIICGKLENKQTVFRSLVEKHEKDIFALEAIVKFPSAYAASLDEIQRRYRSKKNALAFIDAFNNFIVDENKEREEFLKRWDMYLPNKFCPLLTKSFPKINFERICCLIEQDESFPIKEKTNKNLQILESGDFTKILKNLTSSVETMEKNPIKVEELMKILQEDLFNSSTSFEKENSTKKLEMSCEKAQRISKLMKGEPERKENEDPSQILIEILRKIKTRFKDKIVTLTNNLELQREENTFNSSYVTELRKENERLQMEREESLQKQQTAEETTRILDDKLNTLKANETEVLVYHQKEIGKHLKKIESLQQELRGDRNLIERLNNQVLQLSGMLGTVTQNANDKQLKIIELNQKLADLSEQLI